MYMITCTSNNSLFNVITLHNNNNNYMYVPHICLIKCHKNTYKHLRHPKWHTYTSGDKNGDVELTIRVTATK